jgi:peptidoglycan/xylan/chitin deacetylase (PgdA/CDA1 family)
LFPIIALAAAVLAAIAIYWLGPYLFGSLSREIIRKGGAGAQVAALTFDDGPDPRYTPRCLDILEAHRVHATFFLLGQKVKLYPDLARQILARGHDVGNHTMTHRHHWMIGPIQAMREVREGSRAILETVGARPRFFRPSFGVMNLFSYWEALRLGQRCVLWSVAAHDWEGGEGGRSAATIAQDVSSRLQAGAVILLHDSGGAPGAPETMLEALPEIIAEAKRRRLRLVNISEMVAGKISEG